MAAAGIIVLTVFIWSCFMLSAHCDMENDYLPRIGIIGAGIGGTSSAFFLRQLFGDKLQIDVFEADQVGGRAATVDIGGQSFEAGAAVIHKKNRYMLHFNSLYRKDGSHIDISLGNFGLYGSDGMVFEGSDWTFVTLAKLFWRYGFSSYTLQSWIKNLILPQFERIYEFQEKGMAFTTCEDLLRAMGDDIFNMTQYSLEQVMLDAGISRVLTQELGMAAMRNNYGQTTSAQGLVGAISLVGSEPELWSVIGGNKKIPEFLLEQSKANHIRGRAVSVALVKGERVTYELDYLKMDGTELGQTGTREYDFVIIAAPIEGTKNKIAFVDFPSQIPDFSQEYHQTVAAFVRGGVNKTTFPKDIPSDVLTISPDLFFNSIGKPTSTSDPKAAGDSSTKGEDVWKVFFNHVPNQEEISKLFGNDRETKIVDWLAYPEYRPKMDLPPFVLHEHLYYVNAIESAASALEMSAIGAKNVALLAYNHWHNRLDRIDEVSLSETAPSEDSRTEL